MEKIDGLENVEVAPEYSQLFPHLDKMPLYWANLFAKEKIIINQGGTYSGKTESIMRVLFTIAIIRPNTIIHVVSSSMTRLEDDSMKVANSIYMSNPAIRSYLKGDIISADKTYYFKNGSTLSFKTYPVSNQADGPKRDILYISEARRMDWDVVYQLIKRTNIRTFLDYNPVARFWAHDELLDCPVINGKKEFPSVRLIRSWHIHNHFISKEKHDEIESIADPEMWKAYARGLTASLGTLVFPGFSKVPSGFIDAAPNVIWGIDLGFTNDPTVMVKTAVDWKGYDYVFQAFGYAPGIPTGDMAHIMKVQGMYRRGEPCYQDHNIAIRRELRQLGILSIHAYKGKGSELQGILHVRSKKCAFVVDPQGPTQYGLEYELRRHSFLLGQDGKPTNKPEHKHSHGPRAIAYACYTHAVRTGQAKRTAEERYSEDEEN